MNILVTGANGQLGRCLRDRAKESNHDFVFTDYEELDITDGRAVDKYVEESVPDVIVNCAAYTSVDAAEDDAAAARILNSIAPENLARAARRVNAVLIHISTDYVFGDANITRPLNEDDQTAPLGVYGHTKLDGEFRIAKHWKNHIIIRTAWLYSVYGHNFLKAIDSLAHSNPTVRVVDDQRGTPTYAPGLADVILRFIDRAKDTSIYGTYHYTDGGECTWFDFAKEICRDTDCTPSPCTSRQFVTKARRPAYSVLDKTKIVETLGIDLTPWRDNVRTCLNKLNQNT